MSERQPGVPVEAVNTTPDQAVPAAVVVPAAEAVDKVQVAEQAQPVPVNVPQQPAPVQAPTVQKAPESTMSGELIAEVKSGGKNKSNSGKGNGQK